MDLKAVLPLTALSPGEEPQFIPDEVLMLLNNYVKGKLQRQGNVHDSACSTSLSTSQLYCVETYHSVNILHFPV